MSLRTMIMTRLRTMLVLDEKKRSRAGNLIKGIFIIVR